MYRVSTSANVIVGLMCGIGAYTSYLDGLYFFTTVFVLFSFLAAYLIFVNEKKQ